MRTSQITVMSALGAVALAIVVATIAARMILAELDSGDYSEAVARPESADLASGEIDLSGFTRVDARGTWDIELQQGAEWDVTLRYPDDFEDKLDVHVEGNRLVLDYERGSWSWWGGSGDADSLGATITLPALEAIDISGAAELDLGGFNGERLDITASGAAQIHGRDGRYGDLTLVLSGANQVDFGDVVVDDARIVLSGAGEVTLNMNGGTLSGTVSGAGKVRYRGMVADESIVTSGFSSVEALP